MILVDANILLYARNSTIDLHAKSRDWLDEKLNGIAPPGLSWPSFLGFLRIATNPRAFRSPLTMRAAWEQVSSSLSAETVSAPVASERHIAVLDKLLALPRIYGNLVPDAQLAALAIEHGLTMCSTGGDFARSPDLTRLNPLAA